MNWLLNNTEGQDVVFNIETFKEDSPNYALSVKRFVFYEKLRFNDTNYSLNNKRNTYSILSLNKQFSADEYKNVLKDYFEFISPNIAKYKES